MYLVTTDLSCKAVLIVLAACCFSLPLLPSSHTLNDYLPFLSLVMNRFLP